MSYVNKVINQSIITTRVGYQTQMSTLDKITTTKVGNQYN